MLCLHFFSDTDILIMRCLINFIQSNFSLLLSLSLSLSVCIRLMLREEAPSAPPKNIVASGRTNQSIMVQWQPPPEPQLNGVLRGYVLR